ncbi:condensation protein [Gordonia sp. TBRC 11910]|uniref:Condensation protein n=1 Tax=Gordonia asplenii TaxID=2725283 RepID=A0A848KRS7_9ACTN|nr:condensation domain-containing protein [Gordonia asplenii]NMO01120.1 condensation protein [Gordonia asplenii]
MRFIQILEDTVAPGALVEWTPITPPRDEWHSDSRLTSHNHEAHLRGAIAHYRATGTEGGRESWLGLAIEFDEPMSVPAIRAALTEWIDRHEVLRSHVVIRGEGSTGEGLRRVSVAPGAVKLKMGRIGWYSSPDLLIEQIAGSFDRATAPTRWPAYVFATVAREGTFTLLFAADHSLLDGYSLIMSQHELVELYRANRDKAMSRVAVNPNPEPPQLISVGSYVDFSAQERRTADAADATHPALTVWSAFLQGATELPAFGIRRASADAAPTPQASLTAEVADDEQTNRFTAVVAEAGGNLQVGIMAALAVAYRRALGLNDFRVIMPRHTRHEERWLGSLGWFVALAPFSLDTSDDPTFDHAVARAAKELRRTKPAASLPFLRVADLLGITGAPRFVVSILDTRYAPGAREADAGRATVLRSHAYAPDELYIWVNRTPSGLRLSARYPGDSPMTDDVLRYLDEFGRLIAEIGDASTYST